MKLSGRLIDAFLALEQTRRFAIAAERCNVSPSALSQMIGRLEQQVGARLFDRTTRSVSLTPEGEVFLEGAQRIAAEMRATVLELRERVQRKTGRVSLAAPPSMAAEWLPQQMALFRQSHPGIALRLWDVVADRGLEMIRSGDADFGLNTLRGPQSEFETLHLFDDPFYVLCHEGDPMARKRRIKLADLKGRPCIQTLRSGSVWQETQRLVLQADMRDTGFEVNQLGTLGGLVANGFGVALVPKSALQLCRREGVVGIAIAEPGATRPVHLVRRRDRSLSVAAAALWEQLSKSAAKARAGGGQRGQARPA